MSAPRRDLQDRRVLASRPLWGLRFVSLVPLGAPRDDLVTALGFDPGRGEIYPRACFSGSVLAEGDRRVTILEESEKTKLSSHRMACSTHSLINMDGVLRMLLGKAFFTKRRTLISQQVRV